MYLMNRDFQIGRARMEDRLRRAERARVAAEALAGADGRTVTREAPVAALTICDASCEQAEVTCDAA
jgi:hypothetical protein